MWTIIIKAMKIRLNLVDNLTHPLFWRPLKIAKINHGKWNEQSKKIYSFSLINYINFTSHQSDS